MAAEAAGEKMSVSERLKEEGRKIAILECILALMKNLGWDVEQAMDAIDLAEDEKDLYRRVVNAEGAAVDRKSAHSY